MEVKGGWGCHGHEGVKGVMRGGQRLEERREGNCDKVTCRPCVVAAANLCPHDNTSGAGQNAA